jgi:hypothetical protein
MLPEAVIQVDKTSFKILNENIETPIMYLTAIYNWLE